MVLFGNGMTMGVLTLSCVKTCESLGKLLCMSRSSVANTFLSCTVALFNVFACKLLVITSSHGLLMACTDVAHRHIVVKTDMSGMNFCAAGETKVMIKVTYMKGNDDVRLTGRNIAIKT